MTPLHLNSDLRARQNAFNTSSRDRWDDFAEHRRQVTARLAAFASRGGTRLCVLGAGNANDLDLATLLSSFREVHLVDLDGEALGRGADRQEVRAHPSLFLHRGLDVTGMLDTMTSWTPLTPIVQTTLHALATWPADRVTPVLPGPFDVVASTCLISQLLETATHTIGRVHLAHFDVLHAIGVGHLRLLASLLSGGGTAFLISEIASSEKIPDLASLPEGELAALAIELDDSDRLFGGLDRSSLIDILRGDPKFRAQSCEFEFSSPWRWRLHERIYLTRAFQFRRRPALHG